MRVPLPFFSEKWKGKGVGRLGSHRSEIRSSVREKGAFFLPSAAANEDGTNHDTAYSDHYSSADLARCLATRHEVAARRAGGPKPNGKPEARVFVPRSVGYRY